MIYLHVNGVNRKQKQEFAPVGGVNRKIREEWAPVDGVNRKVFSGYEITEYFNADDFGGLVWNENSGTQLYTAFEGNGSGEAGWEIADLEEGDVVTLNNHWTIYARQGESYGYYRVISVDGSGKTSQIYSDDGTAGAAERNYTMPKNGTMRILLGASGAPTSANTELYITGIKVNGGQIYP